MGLGQRQHAAFGGPVPVVRQTDLIVAAAIELKGKLPDRPPQSRPGENRFQPLFHGGAELIDHDAVIDADRPVRRDFGQGFRQQRQGIAAPDLGGLFPVERDGGIQPGQAMGLVAPDQRSQPRSVV